MIQAQAPMNKLYIGIMSGTSVDAIDVVAIEIEDNDFSFVGGVNFELPLGANDLLRSIPFGFA